MSFREKLMDRVSKLIEVCRRIYPWLDEKRGEACTVAALAAVLSWVLNVCSESLNVDKCLKAWVEKLGET